MVTWDQVTNKKPYISTSQRPCLSVETDMAYEKVVTWRVKNLCFHTTLWLPNSTRWWLMTLFHYVQSCMILWSRDYMLSCDKEEALYLQYRKSCGHQIWQGSGLKAIKLKFVKVILLKAIKFMCPNGSFNEMLTSKNRRICFTSELRYTRFQRPHNNKKHIFSGIISNRIQKILYFVSLCLDQSALYSS